ncbi:NADPH-dependent 1-acyldihydroxyacetone phosphate reductase [Cytospora mali]|uniref:NADPH-dependent 1-acyldihydroxyacetone phosphate reductase n=1 Tax=Cytospora mali TaxID=578113 RepID=A0A194W9D5_CYTMA|nr:NADPH-dependent 1-acyldihydroxyacetone phosphate reductase [Valsa mali]
MSPPKAILVTGCSTGGIGAAIVATLAKRDHHVFATARNTSKIPEELTGLQNFTVLELDVPSTASVAEAAKAVASSGRGLDVLINNAGGGYAAPVLDIDIEKAQRLYDINVWGPVRTIQAFADLLIASRALGNISETLRLELSPFGVSVITIMVGAITSQFHNNDVFRLPQGSRYAAIENIISSWASGEAKPKGCSAEQFAESLLEEIVGDGKGGLVWKGPHAGSIKAIVQWLPASLGDWFMSLNQGLHELSEKLVGKDKTS